MKNRYLSLQIKNDLKSKMVFLGGPRQVGKTTLSKNLFPNAAYLNWDYSEDRELILRNELPSHNILIFDEIHKYKKKWNVYNVDLEPRAGTNPGKQRPCICIQPTEFCAAGLGSSLIIPLTTSVTNDSNRLSFQNG